MAYDDETILRTRNMIPDFEPIYGTDGDEYLFSDDQIGYFLMDGRDSPKWAAGLAKIAVGGSEALILKVIKNYETATDGASLMKQWTAAGKQLIDEARQDIIELTDLGYFDIVYAGSDDAISEGETRPIGYPLHVVPPWGY